MNEGIALPIDAALEQLTSLMECHKVVLHSVRESTALQPLPIDAVLEQLTSLMECHKLFYIL